MLTCVTETAAQVVGKVRSVTIIPIIPQMPIIPTFPIATTLTITTTLTVMPTLTVITVVGVVRVKRVVSVRGGKRIVRGVKTVLRGVKSGISAISKRFVLRIKLFFKSGNIRTNGILALTLSLVPYLTLARVQHDNGPAE